MSGTVCENRNRNCRKITERWTYAIPLEVIYLTPLSKWNPYNITYKGNPRSPLGRTVNADGRDGKVNKRRAFNGTCSNKYFMTPFQFFQGEITPDIADTTGDITRVLDSSGNLRFTRASRTRVVLPFIKKVGWVRQRYPIMPIHADGNTVYKELEALKDLIFEKLLPHNLWYQ